ncbi:MAG: hypothetical protein ACK4UK_08095 [Flavobacterium sp.]
MLFKLVGNFRKMEGQKGNKFDFMSVWRNTSFIILVIVVFLALLYKLGVLKPS